jgi:hypothetical protein
VRYAGFRPAPRRSRWPTAKHSGPAANPGAASPGPTRTSLDLDRRFQEANLPLVVNDQVKVGWRVEDNPAARKPIHLNFSFQSVNDQRVPALAGGSKRKMPAIRTEGDVGLFEVQPRFVKIARGRRDGIGCLAWIRNRIVRLNPGTLLLGHIKTVPAARSFPGRGAYARCGDVGKRPWGRKVWGSPRAAANAMAVLIEEKTDGGYVERSK